MLLIAMNSTRNKFDLDSKFLSNSQSHFANTSFKWYHFQQIMTASFRKYQNTFTIFEWLFNLIIGFLIFRLQFKGIRLIDVQLIWNMPWYSHLSVRKHFLYFELPFAFQNDGATFPQLRKFGVNSCKNRFFKLWDGSFSLLWLYIFEPLSTYDSRCKEILSDSWFLKQLSSGQYPHRSVLR